MNSKLLNHFEGIVIIRVQGKKIERFLSYLYRLKIEIIDIKYTNHQSAVIKVFNRDLEKITNMKTTYDVEIIGYGGSLKLKEGLKKHFFLIISLIIGYAILLILSNIIFDVEIIHSNASIRKLLTNELAEHNIKRWSFKQSYSNIEKIKQDILNKYKNRIEWLEIENVGTKYIVKVEERKIKENQSDYTYQDIVSSKNAVIMKIEATSGEIVVHKDDYVKKGDILISGHIMKGEEVSKLIKASGKIYGEVWYNIKVEHPLVYKSKVETGKQHNVYEIQFLSHTWSLFDFHPLKSKKSSYTNIISNPLIPFRFIKDTQKEVVINDELYTDGEALTRAEDQAIAKMQDSISLDEHIISSRKLKYYVEDQKLYLDMFFKVYESIGEPRAITE